MISWLLAASDEVPLHNDWLLGDELATLGALAHPKRRMDWRLGRWVAKQAVGTVLGWPPADVEIRRGSDGAPYACRGGAPVAASLSISHSAGMGLCVVAVPPLAVGCDLETVEQRATVFEEDWFTSTERQLVYSANACGHDQLVTLIWSAKESALKALGSGLRRDTRTVVVDEIGGAAIEGWYSLHVSNLLGAAFEGWWRLSGRFVISVVGASMALPPCPVDRDVAGLPGSRGGAQARVRDSPLDALKRPQ